MDHMTILGKNRDILQFDSATSTYYIKMTEKVRLTLHLTKKNQWNVMVSVCPLHDIVCELMDVDFKDLDSNILKVMKDLANKVNLRVQDYTETYWQLHTLLVDCEDPA